MLTGCSMGLLISMIFRLLLFIAMFRIVLIFNAISSYLFIVYIMQI